MIKIANLVDVIETYLKQMLRNAHSIEIQRNELAKQFTCVPSQINYVLQTRFNVERGYLVESRRGGGGFIRIQKVNLNSVEGLQELLNEGIGDAISQDAAEGFIQRLYEDQIITQREAVLMQAALKKEVLRIGLPERDLLRASILKAMILIIIRYQ